jgi:hypothetical protein
MPQRRPTIEVGAVLRPIFFLGNFGIAWLLELAGRDARPTRAHPTSY